MGALNSVIVTSSTQEERVVHGTRDLIAFLAYYPHISFITVASNRTEVDELERLAEINPRIRVVNETRDLAKNIGQIADTM